MIVKKIRHNKTDRPKEWQINDLVDYIRNPRIKNKGEKIEHAGGLNFIGTTHVAQKLEMIALARETTRSKMPVNHWVFAWPEGEQPTRKQVDELVQKFLEGMGLEGHQTIYALHCDTKNYHVHIAVNRVHPDTLKVVRINNGFDIRQAQKVRAVIEKNQGWSPLVNAPYVVTEEGEIARQRIPTEIKPTPETRDMEAETGEKSALRIAQERGHEIIKNANSWEELHEGLKKVGLRYEKKGSGAIIWVGETAVKPSSVDRAFSMGKLCKRLGNFQEGNYPYEKTKIEAEPLEEVEPEIWQQYLKEKEECEQEKLTAKAEKCNRYKELKEKQKRERREKLTRIAIFGLSMLNIARHSLKMKHDGEKRILDSRLKKKFRKRPKLRFKTWLLMRGKALLLRLKRQRRQIRHTPHPSVPIKPIPTPQEEAFLRYAQAVNADRYRVTAIRVDSDGSRKVMILDKKDGQTRGFTPDELVAKMSEILALRSRGENIYYTPLSEDRHHILIDDMTAESLVQLQKDGYKPAAVIESSPGNFQCVLTVPKFHCNFDREIANRLSSILNKRYGDPKLSGAIHPHRAPGFENRKAKHQQSDGSFPVSLLRYAVKQECQKAVVEARRIEQELNRHRQAKSQLAPAYRPTPQMDAQSAYFAHFENIRAHLTIEDFSRVDAMIALRMRANGHSEGEVIEVIRECAPAIREGAAKRRNWEKYAERTAAYAFGFAGDRDLLRNERYREFWKKLEMPNAANISRQRI